MDLKQDMRCDTMDTREEYEMKVGKGEGAKGSMRAGQECTFQGSEGRGEDRQVS